jgi:hypothetical protein
MSGHLKLIGEPPFFLTPFPFSPFTPSIRQRVLLYVHP